MKAVYFACSGFIKTWNPYKSLGHLISFLFAGDLKEILNQSSLSQLVDEAPQFEKVICRKFDELSYSREEFIHTFCQNTTNCAGYSTGKLKEIMGDLSVKQEIIDKYGDTLKKCQIPIHSNSAMREPS
ncbi:hypothetical protein ACTFIZ_007923 [Dictyostelium cf. discoideum]